MGVDEGFGSLAETTTKQCNPEALVVASDKLREEYCDTATAIYGFEIRLRGK